MFKVNGMASDKKCTPKQKKFASEISRGSSLADAYRSAFSPSPSTKPESIRTLASREYKKVHVRSMVETMSNALERSLQASALSSRTKILKVLEDTIDGKLSKDPDEMDSVRLKAVELLGRNLQMWGSDTTVNVVERDSETLREELTEKLGKELGGVRKEVAETQPEPVDKTKH